MSGRKITDKMVFNYAFHSLRRGGFVARQKFLCCSTCAWSDIKTLSPEPKDVVFYHIQDSESFDKKTGTLLRGIYLAWSGNAQRIVEEFTSRGFKVEWDGCDDSRIYILPKENS